MINLSKHSIFIYRFNVIPVKISTSSFVEIYILFLSIIFILKCHRTGKGQFSIPLEWKRPFQSQRKAMPKNAQTTTQISLILHTSKVMLKIFQVRLQQYVNHELPDVQAGFRKARDQSAKHPLKHQKNKRVPEKTSSSALLTMPKPLTVWITTKWKVLKEMGIPDYLTCLLRNLHANQEAIVRTGHETMVPNWERSMSRLYIVTLLIELMLLN